MYPSFSPICTQIAESSVALDARYRGARQLREPGFHLPLGFIELQRDRPGTCGFVCRRESYTAPTRRQLPDENPRRLLDRCVGDAGVW